LKIKSNKFRVELVDNEKRHDNDVVSPRFRERQETNAGDSWFEAIIITKKPSRHFLWWCSLCSYHAAGTDSGQTSNIRGLDLLRTIHHNIERNDKMSSYARTGDAIRRRRMVRENLISVIVAFQNDHQRNNHFLSSLGQSGVSHLGDSISRRWLFRRRMKVRTVVRWECV
jgi:hypothetical protein